MSNPQSANAQTSDSFNRQVATVIETPLAPANSAASLMDVISRAAADPNTDVDKLERLLGMYERITAQQAKAAFTAALAVVQPELPVIDRKGRITVPAKAGVHDGHSTPYALWEDMNDAIRPILAEHGFALSFRIGMAQDGKIVVTGVLSHRAGHQEETTITLMHDSSGSKNAVQAVGSSVSYGKRYTAMALLNITSRAPLDRDDDGEAAGTSQTAQDAIAEINACETLADLRKWKAEKFDAVSKAVKPNELKEIVSLYNRRVQAMKQKEGQTNAG